MLVSRRSLLNLQRWVSMPSNEKSPKIDIIQPDGTIGRPEGSTCWLPG